MPIHWQKQNDLESAAIYSRILFERDVQSHVEELGNLFSRLMSRIATKRARVAYSIHLVCCAELFLLSSEEMTAAETELIHRRVIRPVTFSCVFEIWN